MEPSILSLIPPVVTITLAIVTKRIFVALGTGIVLGALLYSQWSIPAAFSFIGEIAAGLVYAEGEITEEMYISAFVFLLGVLTAFIYLSGGLTAFAEWAITKVRTRFQAHLVPIVLGIIIFFDDAFSSLVGGNVSRTITDRHRVSRAKLSYLVDSTAAPVIILTPISGWAAFIATTMAGIFTANQITQYNGYEAYLLSIPANYYAITAIILVFFVAWFGLSFGPMRRHDELATEQGVLFDAAHGSVPGEAGHDLPTREDGRVADLLLPVLTLIGVTVAGSLYLGISATDGPLTPMDVLANAEVILALFYGGLAACVVAGVRLLARRTSVGLVGKAALSGLRSMVTAVLVVFLAWMTAEIISELGIGEYVAGLIDGVLTFSLLPVLLFLTASFISFSMGSTFGTFGLLLPVAAEIVAAVDIGLLIPAFGAVLAGAIFGDHTSPLSDTTILSSIGAGIHVIDHVNTQLPYAFVCSAASTVGYVVLGFTRSPVVGLGATLAALAVAVFLLSRRYSTDVRVTPADVAAAPSGVAPAARHGKA
ncbi:MAG: Na+/H+ antiporter NhaC family protein [Actinomycetota bacterium]|nr:Na+/H+ antiporter NhaC family protein [Actinomycetota bacterium]